MKKITDKIVSFSLKEETKPTVQIMHEGISRPEVIVGRTYKIKLPSEDSAIYVTINNITLNAGTVHEETRPFEMFINSKNTSHRQWIDALTRVVSAVFRKGGDIGFLVEELKSITDPNGGGWNKGRYVKSLVSEIGHILEEHINQISTGDWTVETFIPLTSPLNLRGSHTFRTTDSGEIKGANKCPSCGVKALVMKDGCPTCLACGDSKCG